MVVSRNGRQDDSRRRRDLTYRPTSRDPNAIPTVVHWSEAIVTVSREHGSVSVRGTVMTGRGRRRGDTNNPDDLSLHITRRHGPRSRGPNDPS